MWYRWHFLKSCIFTAWGNREKNGLMADFQRKQPNWIRRRERQLNAGRWNVGILCCISTKLSICANNLLMYSVLKIHFLFLEKDSASAELPPLKFNLLNDIYKKSNISSWWCLTMHLKGTRCLGLAHTVLWNAGVRSLILSSHLCQTQAVVAADLKSANTSTI